jgi:hypothetical protein
LGITTLCAFALGIWQAFPWKLESPRAIDAVGGLSSIVFYALPTFLWLVIAWTRPRYSVAISFSIMPVASKLAVVALTPTHFEWVSFLVVAGSVFCFITHAFALRLAGYRLRRDRPEELHRMLHRVLMARQGVDRMPNEIVVR